MDPVTLAIIGASAAAAGGGFLGAKSRNNKMKGISDPLPSYSGYRPPHVSYLRPVEDEITNILRTRAAGQDVGFDPARRDKLLEDFNIEQGRNLEDQKADIKNRLAGSGLSRNAAAYDELMGRALREAGRENNLYRNKVDIEDLTRRNEERDVNTGRLQNLNTFNFGQENNAANFDLDVFKAESGNELARRGLQANAAANYEDPFGSALESGANTFLAGKTLSKPQTSGFNIDPNFLSSSGKYSSSSNLFDDPRYLALKSGKNLSSR